MREIDDDARARAHGEVGQYLLPRPRIEITPFHRWIQRDHAPVGRLEGETVADEVVFAPDREGDAGLDVERAIEALVLRNHQKAGRVEAVQIDVEHREIPDA